MDICNRCLIIQDARITVKAIWNDVNESGETTDTGVEFASGITFPIELKQWVTQVIQRHDRVTFDTGPSNYMFIPISTWHGDPVCPVHLWEAVDGERWVR